MTLAIGGELGGELIVRRRVRHSVYKLDADGKVLNPSKVQQHERDEHDINRIMAKWKQYGTVHVSANQPTFGDFSSSMDYHEALSKLRAAETEFELLPAHVRKHVDNDPGAFLQMVFDPERRAELEDLGMVPEQAPAAAPVAVRVVEAAPVDEDSSSTESGT